MANYTVEVRDICRAIAGQIRPPFDDYTAVQKAIPVIFDFKPSGIDDTFWEILTLSFLQHFYMEEIGAETVDLWKFFLVDRFRTLIDKWFKLYSAWETDYFFSNANVMKEVHERQLTGAEDTTKSGMTNSSNTGTVKNDKSNTTDITKSDSGTNSNETTGTENKTENGTNTSKNTNKGTNTTLTGSTEYDENRVNDTPQTIITVGDDNQYLTSYTQRDHTISLTGSDTNDSTLDVSGSNSNTITGMTGSHSNGTTSNTGTQKDVSTGTDTQTLNTKNDTTNAESGHKDNTVNEKITITKDYSNYNNYIDLIEKYNILQPWLDVVYRDCSDLFMQLLF